MEKPPSGNLPALSGLDSDDEEEGVRLQPIRTIPASEKRPAPAPEKRPAPAEKRPAPTSRPLPKAPVGDLFSDTPTKVAPAPSTSMAAPDLPRLDASTTRTATAAGSMEITITREKSDHPEPTITVAEELLADLGVTGDAASKPSPVPAAERVAQAPPPATPPAPSGQYAGITSGGPEPTHVISVASVERIMPRSGPLPVVRPDGPPSGPHAALTSPDSGQEQTRIVSSLTLKELNEPRARRSRSQQLPSIEEPAPRAGVAKPSGPIRVGTTSKPDRPAGKEKKNFIAMIKARTKAKVAPIDPQRLMVQEEATRSGVLPPSAGIGGRLDDDGGEQPEGTIIGRFLGLVGLAPGQPPPQTPAKVGKDPKQEVWEALQDVPFLDGVNPQLLKDAIAAGDLTLISQGRDMLVECDGRALLLHEGQVALARFDPHVLEKERRAQRAYKPGDKKAEKREQNRRQEVGPLIRLCEANLATFVEGDLITEPIAHSAPERGQGDLALYSVTPVKILSIALPRLEAWRRTYQFFDGRVRNAETAAKGRLAAATGARAQVADFFVRHGMSIAMTLRVREVDKCIECYECEKACEERYGVKRLSLKGKILGALDFVDCCRTCMDQRCIDVCAYDAIKYHDDKKEVLINEEACTGCSMCAIACPYDAIEMHELDERPLLRLRLEKEQKLGFGDGKPRKAAIRRIASKCDHCVNYEDQACISACPTSALLEIPPEAAFIERTETLAEAAHLGYDQPVAVRPDELWSPDKFFRGLKAEDDQGRSTEKRLKIGWLWAVSALGLLLCLIEIALRKLWPAVSAQYLYQTMSEGMDPDVALMNIDYRPGSNFAVWLGYIGSVILFSSMFYSVHKWVPGLRRIGSLRGWFDYHVWAGTMGSAFILVHSAAKLDNWVSFAVWAMLATVISGLVGRYLTTELPDLASQAALRVLDLERQLTELRNRHGGVAAADRYFEGKRRAFARVAAPGLTGIGAGWLAFKMQLLDDLERPFRRLLLRRRLHGIKDRRARAQVARVTSQLVLLERQRMLLPKIEPLFHEWKTIHIPFAIVLSVLASIHIFVELFPG